MSATRLFVRPPGEYGTPLQLDYYIAPERSWISRAIADSAMLWPGYQ